MKNQKQLERKPTKYAGVFYREGVKRNRKEPEKIFYIVFKKNGKVYEEKVGREFEDDLTPARVSAYRSRRIEGKEASRKEKREAARAAKDEHKNRFTIDRLWTEYSANRRPGIVLKADFNRYKKHLQSPFGPKTPDEINQLEVDRLRVHLSKTLAPQTVKHVLNMLTQIVNYGVKSGLCSGLGFHVKKPKLNNTVTETLTPSQFKALLQALDESPDILQANCLKMILYTGLRKSELFRLQWVHLDFERGFIMIVGPKGGVDQTIPMNGPARRLLENHPRTGSPFVFPGRGGRQRTNIQKFIEKIREAGGLPEGFRPMHGLRHVFASELASSGEVDLYTLQKLLTHKNPIMTQRYAHLRDEVLKRGSEVAGAIVDRMEAQSRAEASEKSAPAASKNVLPMKKR